VEEGVTRGMENAVEQELGMFDWVRREWEGWKDAVRDEPVYLDARWLTEDGWEKWIITPPLLNGSPIEIMGMGWTASKTIICGEPLDAETDWDQTLHWRRTGIYREHEEQENARFVAQRLMGRQRLITADSGWSGTQQANMANQSTGMLGASGGFLSNLIGGGPYGMG